MGSDRGPAWAHCYGMAGSPKQRRRSPSLPANLGSVQSKTRAPQPSRTNAAFARGMQPRGERSPAIVESDLAAEMAVGDDELNAIIRLLGDALDDIVSDIEHTDVKGRMPACECDAPFTQRTFR
jgi:hypothetical protein